MEGTQKNYNNLESGPKQIVKAAGTFFSLSKDRKTLIFSFSKGGEREYSNYSKLGKNAEQRMQSLMHVWELWEELSCSSILSWTRAALHSVGTKLYSSQVVLLYLAKHVWFCLTVLLVWQVIANNEQVNCHSRLMEISPSHDRIKRWSRFVGRSPNSCMHGNILLLIPPLLSVLKLHSLFTTFLPLTEFLVQFNCPLIMLAGSSIAFHCRPRQSDKSVAFVISVAALFFFSLWSLWQ